MPTQLTPVPEISDAVIREIDAHRDSFLNARPFKHVMIEAFFNPAFAQELLAEFPSFRSDLAKNEVGIVAGKAVNTKIREISPVYRRLYELISSQPFLEMVSRLSGIPDLILDPAMYGGGTHDNRHGQELDPHVDFNYDEGRNLHRRLNLIVYMNPEWKSEWGGALEIHSNPRNPFKNEISSYDPLFNRCVMFETNEYSWHGFPQINLPEDKRHLSRRSISIYLYTKDRPAAEIVPEHGTFYVQRFLPDRIQAGYTLTPDDIALLRRLLVRRDDWIEQYQLMELTKNGQLGAAANVIKDLTNRFRAPLTGYILQEGPCTGIYPDGWASPKFEISLAPQAPVSALVIKGYRPEIVPQGRLRVTVNGEVAKEVAVPQEGFEIRIPLKTPTQKPIQVIAEYISPTAYTPPGESRELAYVLVELSALHS